MHALARYRAVPLAMRLFVALVAGAAAGLSIGPPVSALAPFGEVLVFALRVLAPFVVAVFVLASVSGTTRLSLGATGAGALTVFAVLGAASAFVGSVAARLAWARAPQITPLALADGASRSWSDLAEVWAGPALRTLDTAIVVVLLVSVPLALAIGVWRDARPAGAGMRIYSWLQRAAAGLTRVVVGVMEYAPVATFALAAVAFGAAGRATGQWMAAAFATVYGAQLAVALVDVLLVALCGHSPRAFMAATSTPLLTALVTGSSAAVLPLELHAAERGLRAPAALARFVLPLGMAVSKIGTTVFLAVLTVVAGALSGHAGDAGWLARVTLLATVTGMATPPIPGGGYLMLGVVFGQLGLPMPLVPLLIGIPFIGKLNTPLNTLGRLLGLLTLQPLAPAPESDPVPGIGA